MSRGLVFGNSGRAGSMALTGMSGELIAASATGSAARAQHPHVTQVGRAIAVITPGRFVGGTGFGPDEADEARGAECQHRDDDGEGEPAHNEQV